MKKRDLLTDAEWKVIEYLWRVDSPKCANDIIEEAEFCHWTAGYLHNVIRSMLKKEVIEVDGLIQNNTQYARTFRAAYSKPVYAAKVVKEFGITKDTVVEMIQALLKELEIEEPTTLWELEK